jgi:hypothetical protein
MRCECENGFALPALLHMTKNIMKGIVEEKKNICHVGVTSLDYGVGYFTMISKVPPSGQ